VKFRLYPYVMSTFAVVLVLSNITAVKLFQWGPFTWTAGIVLFPLAYVLGDVITEVYGYEGAKRIIWVGMAMNALASLTFFLTTLIPPLDPLLGTQYDAVLGPVPRIVGASMVGLWAGKFSNAIVMSRMKVWTRGRHLWMRTIGSSVLGQLIDTLLFASLAFLGVVPVAVIANMVLTGAAFKLVYETVCTPLTYLAVNWFKRVEGVDVFDYDVSYNPFGQRATVRREVAR
jgi:queuosine precursor transporter